MRREFSVRDTSASKTAEDSCSSAQAQIQNAQPYIEHHPIFGYRYVPGTDLELSRPGGGSYHIKVNSQGIRSDREYSFEKPRGVRRIIVCGDSMAAGQFVSNAHRFSELIERRVPDVEVINLSLEGSGTDQQVLLYEHVGLKYEHDLVIVLPFLQNVRRNMVEAREGIDPKTGRQVMRPKPRFVLVDGKLVLRNVPVPMEVSAQVVAQTGGTDARHSLLARFKTQLTALPRRRTLQKGPLCGLSVGAVSRISKSRQHGVAAHVRDHSSL